MRENASFFFSLESFRQNHFKTKMGKKNPAEVFCLCGWIFEPDHPKQFTICQITSILPYLKNVKFLKKREREKEKERKKEKRKL